MKAIKTKYIGPTNTKGSRMRATDEDGNSVTITWDDSLDSLANHEAGAVALCNKTDWVGNLVGGHLKNCMVWVFVDLYDGLFIYPGPKE